MNKTARTLTVTLQSDWRGALRSAGVRAVTKTYQGETLNFETPGAFFANLTERRWAIVHALQGQGQMPVRINVFVLSTMTNRFPRLQAVRRLVCRFPRTAQHDAAAR